MGFIGQKAKEDNKLCRWINMMLSRFCVECMGLEGPYKCDVPGLELMGARYYPSDVLADWKWEVYDAEGNALRHDDYEPREVHHLWIEGWRNCDALDRNGATYLLPENFWTDECESDKW